MKLNLHQKTILVTRKEPEASEFVKKIEKYNGRALVTPLISITPTLKAGYERILQRISDYEWIIFTSANGVKYFFYALEEKKIVHQIKDCRIAAVGTKTNEMLQSFGYEADFIPSVFNAVTMASEFVEIEKPNGSVLLVQGNLSRTVLNQALKNHAIPFDRLEIYATTTNQAIKHSLQRMLDTEKIDYMTFTSPSTVDAFVELIEDTNKFLHHMVVCIGSTTEKRAREYGFKKILVPDIFTVEGMLQVIHQHILEKRMD